MDAYEAGLLGENILGSEFSYDAEVVLTGDSYVAGEETALMEAIEGKRAQPRYRPPFPAEAGLWQKPSNINNVKSLAYVPQIIARGGEWFKSVGTELIHLNPFFSFLVFWRKKTKETKKRKHFNKLKNPKREQ